MVGTRRLLEALDQLLGDDGLEVVGQGLADGPVLVRREQVEDTVDRGRGTGGVDGAEHQVARLGGVNGRLEGFDVAQLADQDHVGVLPHRVLEGLVPVHDVQADLALVDVRLSCR